MLGVGGDLDASVVCTKEDKLDGQVGQVGHGYR
jgi:hypothetical protein